VTTFRSIPTRWILSPGLLLILVLFSTADMAVGQNLVPNPSFETFSSAPTSFGQITNASPWYSVNGSSDLFHTSASSGSVGIPANYFGNQAARTGSAYSGIAYSSSNSYHELIGVPLTSALTVGQNYYFEAYVSAGEGPYMYGTNNFGAYFTTSALSGTPVVVPHVNHTSVITSYTTWTQVSGTFTPASAFTYMSLGNFYTPAATTWVNLGASGSIGSQYWFIEDVVVQLSTSLPLQLTQLSARLQDNVTARIEWAAENHSDVRCYNIHRTTDGGNTFTDIGRIEAEQQASLHTYSYTDQPGVYSQKVHYRIKETMQDGTVHYSDLAEVYMPFPGLQEGMNVFPNPSSEDQPITLSFPTVPGEESADISVFDLSGREVFSQSVSTTEGATLVDLSAAQLSPGIYFVKVSSGMESATIKIRVN
jgi:hypothetical protein